MLTHPSSKSVGVNWVAGEQGLQGHVVCHSKAPHITASTRPGMRGCRTAFVRGRGALRACPPSMPLQRLRPNPSDPGPPNPLDLPPFQNPQLVNPQPPNPGTHTLFKPLNLYTLSPFDLHPPPHPNLWRQPDPGPEPCVHSLLPLPRPTTQAYEFYVKDRDYLVRDDQVVIIDQNTGRLRPSTRWMGGIHRVRGARVPFCLSATPVGWQTRLGDHPWAQACVALRAASLRKEGRLTLSCRLPKQAVTEGSDIQRVRHDLQCSGQTVGCSATVSCECLMGRTERKCPTKVEQSC